MNELINKDNEWIIHFMSSLDSLLARFEHLTANYRPTLGGERFFTDKEVSARLKVSRRTLQDYRNEGRIALSIKQCPSLLNTPSSKSILRTTLKKKTHLMKL